MLYHLIKSLNPAAGGVTEAVYRIVKAMRAISGGPENTVVTLDPPDSPWLEAFPCSVVGIAGARGYYGYTPALNAYLERVLQPGDKAILHGLHLWNTYGGYRSLRKKGIAYAVMPHGMLDPYFKKADPLKHWKKQLYWWLCEGRVLRNAEAILFTRSEEARLARQTFWPYRVKERPIPFGTEAPEGDPEAQKAAFFQQFPEVDRSRPFLLFLSRIHPKKGVDLLVKSFRSAGLGDAGPALLIAGPCQDREYLTALKALAGNDPRIQFLPMLKGDVKYGAFRAADAFILPSHQENFGIVVAEALACGTPVLISDKVNIWREIQEAGAGMVEADTAEGTGRLITRWQALEPAAKARMRAAAVPCFEKHFEVSASARAIKEFVSEE